MVNENLYFKPTPVMTFRRLQDPTGSYKCFTKWSEKTVLNTTPIKQGFNSTVRIVQWLPG